MGDITSRSKGDEHKEESDRVEAEKEDEHVSVECVSETHLVASCKPLEEEQEEMTFYSTSPYTLSVVLESQQNGHKKIEEISLTTYPKTGVDLKRQIETRFHIPVCIQHLQFYNTTIHDDSNLKKLRIQHGDTLHLQYPSEVDIDYFSTLIRTLSCISTILHRVVPELLNGEDITEDMHELLEADCIAFTGDSIPLKYFSVYPTGTPNANQLYFIHNNGLHLLLEVYRIIHQLPWHGLPTELQELEFSCLQIIWNFSATLGIRQLILQVNTVIHCLTLDSVVLTTLR